VDILADTALTPVMMALIYFGMPGESINRDLLRQTDWGAIIFVGLGFGLIYAALDQGNRLDWLNSGTVIGLLAGGGLLVIAGTSTNGWSSGRSSISGSWSSATFSCRPCWSRSMGSAQRRPPSSCRISDARPRLAGFADRRCVELDRLAAIRHRAARRACAALD
jgi:hypothetical protein